MIKEIKFVKKKKRNNVEQISRNKNKNKKTSRDETNTKISHFKS